MKRLRKILFWLHLVLGLASGIVIAILALTGAALAFEKKSLEWTERDRRVITRPTGDTEPLPIATLLQRLGQSHPDAVPSSLTLSSDPSHATLIALGRAGALYVNPYTAEAQPRGAEGLRYFYTLMIRWHRWLGVPQTPPVPPGEKAPPPGFWNRTLTRSIVGYASGIFVVICFSGLWIWWPRHWNIRAARRITLVSFRLRGKSRDWNWHNAIGAWTALPLIVIGFTGVLLTFPPLREFFYPLRVEAALAISTPAPGAKPLTPDALFTAAQAAVPRWKSISIRLGNAESRVGTGGNREPQPLSVSVIDDGWAPVATQLQFDPYTGELLRKRTFADLSLRQALQALNRTLHTGESFGIPGQIVAFLASLGALFLVYTGFALSWRRFFKAKTARVPTIVS